MLAQMSEQEVTDAVASELRRAADELRDGDRVEAAGIIRDACDFKYAHISQRVAMLCECCRGYRQCYG